MKMQIQSFIVVALASATMPAARATVLTEAKITQIIRDVRTVDSGKAPRRASLNEPVTGGKSVRTGIESRTELLFNDQTITRIGANSHFSFNEGTRDLSLSKGVILLQVPKGLGGARIETAGVVAGVTGTTILLEAGARFTKLIVIEGRCFVIPKAGQLHRRVVVRAGQEVIMPNKATEVPVPVDINLDILVKTSRLLTGVWGAKLEEKRIAAAIAAQLRQPLWEGNIAYIAPGTRPDHLAEIPNQVVTPVPVPLGIPQAPAATAVTTTPQPNPRTNPGIGGTTP